MVCLSKFSSTFMNSLLHVAFSHLFWPLSFLRGFTQCPVIYAYLLLTQESHLPTWWNNSTMSVTWGENMQPSWAMPPWPTTLAVHPKRPGRGDNGVITTSCISLSCPSHTPGFPLTPSPTLIFTTPRPCSVLNWCVCSLLDWKCQESQENHHTLITACLDLL